MSTLLDIESLTVDLVVGGGSRTVVHDVDLSIGAGESLGLIGESGSGKSMSVRAIARLLPRGARTGGRITFDGRDVLGFDAKAMRAYRTEGIAMIF
ncbi:ATP-binding cassette domain-containing protein, partial [Streptomyces sp. SID3343]|uniref:ATP-binding cassette domain-containing protein n=1 Tax=Streptomyces sp. SID3343 TaxID=2690260 RepID=UPI0013720039